MAGLLAWMALAGASDEDFMNRNRRLPFFAMMVTFPPAVSWLFVAAFGGAALAFLLGVWRRWSAGMLFALTLLPLAGGAILAGLQFFALLDTFESSAFDIHLRREVLVFNTLSLLQYLAAMSAGLCLALAGVVVYRREKVS